MKKILGSLLLIITVLFGETDREYYFKADLSKQTLFSGETAVLTVSFYRHRDINTVLGRFKPHSHDSIRFEEFQIESESIGEYDIEHYVYLVRFEKAGNYTLPVTAEARKYNEQDLIDSSNHRDAMNVAAASTEQVTVARFEVSVKASGSALPVGEFSLTVVPDESEVLVHEPAHFTVVIEGEGDIGSVPFPQVAIEGAKVFAQEGERNRWLENGKIVGRKSNQYAVVAEGEFRFPALTIQYFSPRKGGVAESRSEAHTVSVRRDPAFTKASLLDAKEGDGSDTSLPTVDELITWGVYGLLFLSGYLAAKLKIRLPKKSRRPEWIEGLKETQEPKELLARLLPHIDNPLCRDTIERLEADSVDRGEFGRLKKELIDALVSNKTSLG